MPSRIYRGPANREPRTISNRIVQGALLPCTAVLVSQYQFNQATSATAGRFALLANRDWHGSMSGSFASSTDPLSTPYSTGDTGVAFVLEPGQEYVWAMAAGTYTNGQALTIGAGGYLTAAGGSPVVAYYDGGTNVTYGTGALADVVIA